MTNDIHAGMAALSERIAELADNLERAANAAGRSSTTAVDSITTDGPSLDRLANAIAQRLAYVTGR